MLTPFYAFFTRVQTLQEKFIIKIKLAQKYASCRHVASCHVKYAPTQAVITLSVILSNKI